MTISFINVNLVVFKSCHPTGSGFAMAALLALNFNRRRNFKFKKKFQSKTFPAVFAKRAVQAVRAVFKLPFFNQYIHAPLAFSNHCQHLLISQVLQIFFQSAQSNFGKLFCQITYFYWLIIGNKIFD